MSHQLVEVQDLHFTWPDGTPGLRGVGLRVTRGEAVALVGANGAGKSTLLLHLCGALLPTRGSVRVGEVPVTPETLPLIRRAVGMVFQDPDDQLFLSTVQDDVAFGPGNLGLPPTEVTRRVDEALARVGALHLRDRPPWRLSGGEKRAVAIATVLSMSPDLLVMDEPSSHLDPRSRRALIGLLQGFTHTRLIATHDLDLALEVCSRTIVLGEGRVLADGRTGEILQDDALLAQSRLERPLRWQ
jgi:cobalt/nickel transport system ATP-binding protein